MKRAFAVAIFLAICLFMASGLAQESGRFQAVGGDYGRTLIDDLKADETEAASESDTGEGLWGWGSSPKGTIVVDGSLIGDPKLALNKLKVVQDWLGESLVDAYDSYGASGSSNTYVDSVTGEPVPTFIDPMTGEPYYKYTDPVSGKLIYVYFNPQTGEPTRTSFVDPATQSQATQSQASQFQEVQQGTFSLPPIFR